MNSPFSICENNHVWTLEMDRRTKALERRLKSNPIDDVIMRELEKSTLRYRIGHAIASIVRRPVTTQSSQSHSATDVRPATNR